MPIAAYMRFAIFLLLPLGALTAAGSTSAVAQVAAQTGKGEGDVRRIDKDAKKITIHHGPLDGIAMPAMTMVFQVADPAMLDAVAVGDKVRFTVVRGGGAFTLQTIERLK